LTPEVGKTLREARTRQGVELGEVEQATKIRAKFLRAMEEERWEVLPGAAYARGFLATYAHYLGLDAAALVEQYARGTEQSTEEGPIPAEMLPKPGMAKGRRLRPGAVIVAVAALAAIALVIVVLTGGDEEGGVDGGSRPASAEADNTVTTDTTTTEPETTTTAETNRIPLELRATGSVWVCLVDKDGEPLVDGETLAAGDERGPFAGRAFEVTVGNGAIEITADDEPIEVADAAEPVGYRITADGIRELNASQQPVCL
jgi:cytoskeleton protein RodZ